jgi:hypothetical protein
MEQVKVEIDESGGIVIETSGFSGDACKKIIEEVVSSLGGREESSSNKPEMYNKSSVKVKGKNK